jgi:CheY-like chemotaxis protein
LPASGPIVCANAGQIQQILTSLLTNAQEATGESQGVINLTLKTVTLTDIPASKRFPVDWQTKESTYACLEVADAGSGIADRDIEKLFDPFFTTKFTGRGMGLSVVLGIVQAHGGGVTVESKSGQGSVFRVFLPVSTEEVLCQPEKMVPAPRSADSGTVLLIEDEEQVRNMAQKMLIRLGYKVVEAKDGVEAMAIFKMHQDEIRCVLSDLTMPRMNGWDTLAALRNISPNIPVILSSGYDEAQVMAGEHPDQPSAFLGKPYQLKGLRETINRVLTDQK